MKRHWSIRAQLFALMLAVAIPLIGLLIYSITIEAQDEAQQASIAALNLAQLTSANVQQFLADSEILLARLARRPLIRAVDPARCDPFLEDIHDLHPAFANIVVADLSGQIVCIAQPQSDGPLPSAADRGWFQTVRRTGAFTVGEVQIGRITGKWVSVLAYPIHNETGELVGVLGLPVDLVHYQMALNAVSLPNGTIITILDAEDTVVARSVEPEKWVGQNVRDAALVNMALAQDEGQAQAQGLDGVDRIWGFTTIPGPDWRVSVGVPTEVIFAPVQATALRNGLFALTIILLVAVLALYLGRQIERPIRHLAQATEAIAVGQLETRMPVEGPAEIAEVARQFNAMLAIRARAETALQESQEQLRLAIRASNTGLWDWNIRNNAINYSPEWKHQLGYKEHEVENDFAEWINRLHPDDRERMLSTVFNSRNIALSISNSSS